MAYMNKVIIMGRLGKDPELRYTQNHTPVCTLSVATKDYRKNTSGERQEFTEWHRVVVWSHLAENASKYLTKGRGLFVEGRLQTRSWEDQNGQKRYSTEIVANNLQYLPQSTPHYQTTNTNTNVNANTNTNAGYSTASDTSYSPENDNGGGFPMAASPQNTNTAAVPQNPNYRSNPVNNPAAQATEKLPVIQDDEGTDDAPPTTPNTASTNSTIANLPF
ncbi:MAG: single-stranded DNA-binding protein [Proteobacteria bacterium]|nr:single-stranded DNA-binding protein [Pseudomonadota bacterium]